MAKITHRVYDKSAVWEKGKWTPDPDFVATLKSFNRYIHIREDFANIKEEEACFMKLKGYRVVPIDTANKIIIYKVKRI